MISQRGTRNKNFKTGQAGAIIKDGVERIA